MGLFSGIYGLIQGGKQKKLARSINPVNATYEESKYIKDLYGQGKNLYQGRMAGANQMEQNILSNQANTVANVERNATSGAQALALAAGLQGNTNQQFSDLALREAQDKQNRFGVLSNVSQLMTQEGDKVYQDKLRKYYDDLNYKRALEGASQQNKASFFQGLDDTVQMAASMFMPGIGSMMGGAGGGGTSMGGGVNTSPYTMTTPNYPIPNIQRGPMPVPTNRSGLY